MPWLHRVSKVTLSKSRRLQSRRESERARHASETAQQRGEIGKHASQRQGQASLVPRLHEQLKLYSKGKHINKVEVIGETQSQLKREKTGYSN